jgi:hypothetical protein
MRSVFFTMTILIFSFSAKAAVWEDNQAWSIQYEEEYSNWMQSNSVSENIFTNPQSPYFGVSTDCADTAYALRAIFSFEHKLPFVIYSPSGSRGTNKTINNRLSNWDNKTTERERLVAMINEIGDSVGTENLAYFDSYPVSIKKISPGSVFMYKIVARFGKFIRHTYNIKNISEIGTFDVIYSTQANKAKGLPLIRRKDEEFDKLPTDPWGFKKFRWPEQLGLEVSALPAEMNASNEQFIMAKALGEREFFKMVSKTLSVTNESPAERLARSFKTVCLESQARIGYVNQGLAYLKEINNRCMNYEEFDAYSTPSRDESLKELFLRYESSYNDLIASGTINTASPELLAFSELIFKKKATNADLLAACPVNYRNGVSLDLSTLWKRIQNVSLSSHPNDAVEARWGESNHSNTRCKRGY